MSIIVPLHKWRSADPAILIGRRCIAQTDQDVVIDGRLELIRHPDGTATNPRKWRRPAPCPACRKSRPLILTLGTIYKLRTRKPVNTIYGCICPNCRHKCILHVDGRSLKKAIRLWNHHASHQRNEQ